MSEAKLLKSYLPDGSQRAIWSEQTAPGFLASGVMPERASRVEVIRDGPLRGRFYVDFSLLADLTGCDHYRVCLRDTFPAHEPAVRAEAAWLIKNWVLTGGE